LYAGKQRQAEIVEIKRFITWLEVGQMWRNGQFDADWPRVHDFELGLKWFTRVDLCWTDAQQVDR